MAVGIPQASACRRCLDLRPIRQVRVIVSARRNRDGVVEIVTRAVKLLFLLFPALSIGHHDALSQFDIETFIELEGVVTDVRWSYPHVVIKIAVIDEQGPESWTLQTQDPAMLRQLGIAESPIRIGDTIRTYGWAPRRANQRESFIYNLLLPSGVELVLERNGPLRLSE